MDNRSFTPPFLVIVGVLIIGVMAVETAVRALSPSYGFGAVTIVNMVTALPFIAMLFGLSYVLWGYESADPEHARIVPWVIGGAVYFSSFFLLVAILGGDELFTQIQIVRWGIAAGAGSGALVGFFEFRAIERALANERVEDRNEALRDEKARLNEFASIISHDLRNPLNVAEGYLELLENEYDDDRFDRIEGAHDRMHQIIEDTLLLARSDRHVDDPEPVELETMVRDCWETVETEEADIEIVGDATILADPQHLRRLFGNLIRNAVEHAGPDVTIRVTATPEGFMVEDDGPGIPPDEREDVFEAGYSTSDEGIGFGLRIVRHVADAHGWDIELTEGDDGGARFDVTGVAFAE